MLSVIIALGENREIGLKGKMPWHIQKDLAYFRRMTIGSDMIMGRKTFESLPKILPERKHIVLTRNKSFQCDHPNVVISNDPDGVFQKYGDSPEEVFVIGGGDIIAQALPKCGRLYLTHIYESFEADTFLPPIDFAKYKIVGSSKLIEDAATKLQYKWVIYQKL